MKKLLLVPGISAVFMSCNAMAQLAVSANDNKLVNQNGKNVVVANPAPDSISIIDLSSFPPKITGEVPVPTSVVGPPSSVAIAPDESFALVTSAQKHDPADASKLVDNNRVSVIDLKAKRV